MYVASVVVLLVASVFRVFIPSIQVQQEVLLQVQLDDFDVPYMRLHASWNFDASAVRFYRCLSDQPCLLLQEVVAPSSRTLGLSDVDTTSCASDPLYYVEVLTASGSVLGPSVVCSGSVPIPSPVLYQLAFPPFADESAGARGAALFRSLIIVFVMLLMHVLYYMFAENTVVETTVRVEDILILFIFSIFHFIFLWMPERMDLQAAAFTLWLILFIVRKTTRSIILLFTR